MWMFLVVFLLKLATIELATIDVDWSEWPITLLVFSAVFAALAFRRFNYISKPLSSTRSMPSKAMSKVVCNYLDGNEPNTVSVERDTSVGKVLKELSALTGHPFIGLFPSIQGVPIHLQSTIEDVYKLDVLITEFKACAHNKDELDKNKLEDLASNLRETLGDEMSDAMTRWFRKLRQDKPVSFDKLYTWFNRRLGRQSSEVEESFHEYNISIDVVKYTIPVPDAVFEEIYENGNAERWEWLRELMRLRHGTVKGITIDQIFYFEKGDKNIGKTIKQVGAKKGELSKILKAQCFEEWTETDFCAKHWTKTEYGSKQDGHQKGYGNRYGSPFDAILCFDFLSKEDSMWILNRKNVLLTVSNNRYYVEVPTPINFKRQRTTPLGLLQEKISEGETIHAVEPDEDSLSRNTKVGVLVLVKTIKAARGVVTKLLDEKRPLYLEKADECPQWLKVFEFIPFENGKKSALLTALQDSC